MVTVSGVSIHTQFIRSGLNFEPELKTTNVEQSLNHCAAYHLRKYVYIFDYNRIHNWIESISSPNNVPWRWFLDRVRTFTIINDTAQAKRNHDDTSTFQQAAISRLIFEIGTRSAAVASTGTVLGGAWIADYPLPVLSVARWGKLLTHYV